VYRGPELLHLVITFHVERDHSKKGQIGQTVWNTNCQW
jgi:hypothetical protein